MLRRTQQNEEALNFVRCFRRMRVKCVWVEVDLRMLLRKRNKYIHYNSVFWLVYKLQVGFKITIYFKLFSTIGNIHTLQVVQANN